MIKGREERDGTRHRRNRAMMGSVTEEIQGTQEPKKKKMWCVWSGGIIFA